MRLTDVLYVPSLKENLFSVRIASRVNGAKIIIENGLCQVMKNNRVALNAKKWGGVFQVMAALIIEPEEERNVIVNYHH